MSRARNAADEVATPEAILMPVGLGACGPARPSLPVSVFGEDFSLLIRIRRMRIARGRVLVLN